MKLSLYIFILSFLGQLCYGMASRVMRCSIPLRKMAIDCVTKRGSRGFFYSSIDLEPVLSQEFYEEMSQEFVKKVGELPLSFLQERMERSLFFLFGYEPPVHVLKEGIPIEEQEIMRTVNEKKKELSLLDPKFIYGLSSKILATNVEARAYYHYSKIVHKILAHRLQKELGDFGEEIVLKDDLLLIESNIFSEFAHKYIRDTGRSFCSAINQVKVV